MVDIFPPEYFLSMTGDFLKLWKCKHSVFSTSFVWTKLYLSCFYIPINGEGTELHCSNFTTFIGQVWCRVFLSILMWDFELMQYSNGWWCLLVKNSILHDITFPCILIVVKFSISSSSLLIISLLPIVIIIIVSIVIVIVPIVTVVVISIFVI